MLSEKRSGGGTNTEGKQTVTLQTGIAKVVVFFA